MYLVLAIVSSLVSACAVTFLIFWLAGSVGTWPGRKFALLFGTGLVLTIALFGSVNKIPKKHETWTVPCDSTRETGCHNGVYVSTLESNSDAGEVAKLGLITTATGMLFGLFMLSRLWFSTDRRPKSPS